jgi:hypothetical protein
MNDRECSNSAAFKGANKYGFSRWKSNGVPASEMVLDDCLIQAYRVVKIIKNPVSNPENNLEFRVRVLEKENEILTRLLMKEGKL